MTFGIIAADAARLDSIRSLSAGVPMDLVLECADADELDFAIFDVSLLRPDIVVLDARLAGLCDVISRVAAGSSDADVLVVLEDHRPESILAVLRAGAREVACPPHCTSLPEAMEHLAALRSIIIEPHYGRIIGFLSAKGGCGSTSLAIHVAASIGRRKTLLVDLDLDVGVVGFLLHVQSPFSIADAAYAERLDCRTLARLTCNYRGFLDVLLAPSAGEDGSVSPSTVKEVLRSARRHYDFAIADLGRGISVLKPEVLQCLDRLYLVTTHDLTALYKTRETALWCASQGLRPDNLRLLVNRMPASTDLSVKNIEKAVGVSVAATLPDAGPELDRAYLSGALLPRSNKLAQALELFTKSMLEDLDLKCPD